MGISKYKSCWRCFQFFSLLLTKKVPERCFHIFYHFVSMVLYQLKISLDQKWYILIGKSQLCSKISSYLQFFVPLIRSVDFLILHSVFFFFFFLFLNVINLNDLINKLRSNYLKIMADSLTIIINFIIQGLQVMLCFSTTSFRRRENA